MASQYVSVEEASKKIGCSTSQIYRWLKQEKGGKVARYGSKYLVETRDLDAIKKFRDEGVARRGWSGGVNIANAKVALINANKTKHSAEKLSASLKDMNSRAETLMNLINYRIAHLEAQIAAAAPKPSENVTADMAESYASDEPPF